MTVPLNDADYAAIRTRVLGEIVAERRRRRVAIAFATAAMLAFALWLQEPKPAPQLTPKKTAIRVVAPAVLQAVPFGLSADRIVPVKQTLPRKQPVPSERLRIELHTHDPDIRIIWIVPSNKEES
jgi:hypothetical protein